PKADPPVYPPAQDIYAIPDVNTDFSGSQFQVVDPSTFQVSLNRQVHRAGSYVVPASMQNSLASVTFSFIIGSKAF
ncbi:MAG: hypothetical protein K6T83_03570, partial [Alicyclobacillus sp.]|nr:hypothetical protein [Alicyclobacillus sp.]